jgi:hypothetical protein
MPIEVTWIRAEHLSFRVPDPEGSVAHSPVTAALTAPWLTGWAGLQQTLAIGKKKVGLR